ncbi:MAG: hypothetical protein MZV63_17255 [Marinilabiliales bacterium]|nr:hypothetical protein [Marinilabiliales bacterium]
MGILTVLPFFVSSIMTDSAMLIPWRKPRFLRIAAVDHEAIENNGHNPQAVIGEDRGFRKSTRSHDELVRSRSSQSVLFWSSGSTAERTMLARPRTAIRFDGLSLVRHGGGAHLLCTERLLYFANLGPLERADLNTGAEESCRCLCVNLSNT